MLTWRCYAVLGKEEEEGGGDSHNGNGAGRGRPLTVMAKALDAGGEKTLTQNSAPKITRGRTAGDAYAHNNVVVHESK